MEESNKSETKVLPNWVELLSTVLVYYPPNEFSGFDKELVSEKLKAVSQG